MTNRPILTLDSEIKFGKYEGSTIEWILDNDTGYIDYMLNEQIIELDNEAYEYYKTEMKQQNL